ncbi:MAG TPA: FAD-dependent oxidoreductase [Marinagarivorans sp.]
MTDITDAKSRSATSHAFDVIVIGAGIQGAGVAQAMAAEGYRVALVEQAERPASGTSSKSSKLIHGGLRYLETAQWSLVRECLQERRILTRIAPELVTMKPFYLPVYQHQKRSPLWIHCGLLLYRLLGGGRYQRHSPQKAVELGLRSEGLTALFEYRDAQTDDVKLTHAVVASAKALGTACLFNFRVSTIAQLSRGYTISADDGRTITASAVVNATGPFVNRVAQYCRAWPTLAIDLVQGSHLILDLPAPPGCIYTESPDDGRAVFLLPWYGKLMVGTTELSRGEQPELNEVTPQERDYLLRVAAHALADIDVSTIKIIEAFSGLRVLPQSDNGGPQGARAGSALNKKARDTRLLHQLSQTHQYIAIYGGKLTAYRAVAQKVVAQLKPHHPPSGKRKALTHEIPLSFS